MKHRLFVAITAPAPVVQEISLIQKELELLGMPVRWQPPEKLHLTLNFLGRQTDEQIPGIKKLLARVASSTPRFSLSFIFLETMYQKHDPSYIYLGPDRESSDQLKNLQSELVRGLSSLEIPQPSRFLPHMTIGQLKRTDPTATKRYLDLVASYDYHPVSSFEVAEITLYESFVSRVGSTFSLVGRFMLYSS